MTWVEAEIGEILIIMIYFYLDITIRRIAAYETKATINILLLSCLLP